MKKILALILLGFITAAQAQEVGDNIYYQKDGMEYFGTVKKVKKDGLLKIRRMGNLGIVDEINPSLSQKNKDAPQDIYADVSGEFTKYDAVEFHYNDGKDSRCLNAWVIASFNNGKTLIFSDYLLQRGIPPKIFATTKDLHLACKDQQPNKGMEYLEQYHRNKKANN